jgi:hypothetical protein
MTAARYTDSRPSLQRLSDALTLAVMAALTVASAAVMASVLPEPAEPLRLPMVVVTAKSSAQTAAQTRTNRRHAAPAAGGGAGAPQRRGLSPPSLPDVLPGAAPGTCFPTRPRPGLFLVMIRPCRVLSSPSPHSCCCWR